MSDEPIDYELQIEAMKTIVHALKPLDEKARDAVLAGVNSLLGRQTRDISSDNSTPRTQGNTSDRPAASQRRDGTVSMVAQKIGAKSARDLLLAAGTHLTLFQGKDSFTKDELIACTKDARGWKADYSNQMAINIKRMIDAGTLFEKSKNVFSLSEAVEGEMETKLAL